MSHGEHGEHGERQWYSRAAADFGAPAPNGRISSSNSPSYGNQSTPPPPNYSGFYHNYPSQSQYSTPPPPAPCRGYCYCPPPNYSGFYHNYPSQSQYSTPPPPVPCRGYCYCPPPNYSGFYHNYPSPSQYSTPPPPAPCRGYCYRPPPVPNYGYGSHYINQPSRPVLGHPTTNYKPKPKSTRNNGKKTSYNVSGNRISGNKGDHIGIFDFGNNNAPRDINHEEEEEYEEDE